MPGPAGVHHLACGRPCHSRFARPVVVIRCGRSYSDSYRLITNDQGMPETAGHPQQNASRANAPTLKKEATRRPGSNSLQQQERFDAFVRGSMPNGSRALDEMPVELYLASTRPYDGFAELIYPFHGGSMSRFYGVIRSKLPRLNAGAGSVRVGLL